MYNTVTVLLFVFYGLPALAGMAASFSLYQTMPGSDKKKPLIMLIPVVGAVILYYYLPRTAYDVVKAVRNKQQLNPRSSKFFEGFTGEKR